MAVECEAILLGREAIHGTANASALAALVKNFSKKSSECIHRRYILRCSKEVGVEMVPLRRADDEGFESDEDLTSLGSFEEGSSGSGSGGSGTGSGSSMYVMDHTLKIKNAISKEQKSSHLSRNEEGTATVSVSSFGTDSANSSGASDDDVDGSGNHCSQFEDGKRKLMEIQGVAETYSFSEIAFCHTDPALPKIIVWVVKTKRKSSKASGSEYSYGLDAIVFFCRNEDKFKALCRHFQELSRRSKLDKSVKHATRWSAETSAAFKGNQDNGKSSVLFRGVSDDIKSVSEKDSGYNLIQRVDTDGVTHIEVSRTSATDRSSYFPNKLLSDNMEPSSIISIDTPESGNIRSVPKVQEKQIESVIRVDVDYPDGTLKNVHTGLPPERPERKKYAKKNIGKEKPSSSPVAPGPGSGAPGMSQNQRECAINGERVVKGQFIRVSVDPKPVPSSPITNTRVIPNGNRMPVTNEAKPVNNVLSYHSPGNWNNVTWSFNNNNNQGRTSGGSPVRKGHRSVQIPDYGRRSRSSVHVRRYESPSRHHRPQQHHHPMSHRYIDAFPPSNNSLPNRFFGKLKELTIGSSNQSHPHPISRFKRRNSIGDLANANFYQYPENPTLYKNHHRPLTKSTPNLKSVIKNKNGKFPRDKNSENNEPKKVTFSAYATVQVVD